MSELFTSNEQLFLKSIESLTSKLEDTTQSTKEKKEAAIREGQEDLNECENLLRHMESEVAVLPPQSKAEHQPMVRHYRMKLDQIKRKFLGMQERFTVQMEKETLMGAGMDEAAIAHNARLLNHEERMRKQNENLENAKRTGYEIEDIAIGIERDIGEQNVRASSTQGKVRNVTGMLGDSNSIIARMMRREALMKLILTGVIVLIVIGLLLILYYKFIN